MSEDILEKTENPITKENFDKTEDKIKLNIKNGITLKKFFIDELDLFMKKNEFKHAYNCYKKDNNLIVRLEAPGNNYINSHILYQGEYNCIKISGSKKKIKSLKKKRIIFII